MHLGNEEYDAGSPLELFRANEEINARKRRWFTDEVSKIIRANGHSKKLKPVADVRRVIMELAGEGKVVIYQQPLEIALPENKGDRQRYLIDEIARLQAIGKIDIHLDLQVTFAGDRRVLQDLKLLAENGYGEDNFGNNIALPAELSYLRR